MTIDLVRGRMLTALRADHDAAPPERWQQRKSAGTRLRLVETAVDHLVERGYARLSAASVAESCGVSRGAMHHHFATRMDLVSAAIEHVFYQRMRQFLDDYARALEEQGEEHLVEIASTLHWQSVHSRDYAAYMELAIAARTDPELAEHFLPQARRYDDIWFAEMTRAFPQWQAHWEGLRLANDLTIAAHIGMLILEPSLTDPARLDSLRALVIRTTKGLFDGK